MNCQVYGSVCVSECVCVSFASPEWEVVFTLWTAKGWAVDSVPLRGFPQPILSHHSLGFSFFHCGNAAPQPSALTIGDAAPCRAGLLQCPRCSGRVASQLAPTAQLVMTSERLALFPPHQGTVPQSFTYLATLTLPIGPFQRSPKFVFFFSPCFYLCPSCVSLLPTSFHLGPDAFAPSQPQHSHSKPCFNKGIEVGFSREPHSRCLFPRVCVFPVGWA